MKPEVPYEATEALQRLTWKDALIGIAVMVGFFLFAKIAGWLVRRSLARRTGSGGSIFALSKLLSYILVLVGVATGLNLMGLPLSALLLTSSALLVGIGFSLQHIARDFIAGVIILVEQPIRRNDFVEFGSTAGTVREIGLRATHMRTREGVDLIVPNHLLVANEVSNRSHPLRRDRLRVEIPVSLLEDVGAVAEVLSAVAAEHSDVLSDPAPMVRIDAIHVSHFELALIVWVDDPAKTLRVASELRFAVARAFSEHGIAFPTPELLVHTAVPRSSPDADRLTHS